MSNSIQKHIDINAPIEKVWDALTDSKKFGEWFGVRIDGPFVVGEMSTGVNNYKDMKWESKILKMDAPRHFSYAWHPYPIDASRDYSVEERTLVEFTLTATATGTRVDVIESGFDKIAKDRLEVAFSMHTGGWEAQLENIKAYAEK
jgi:uncharacterized protein YndB with AHSA1/START domain